MAMINGDFTNRSGNFVPSVWLGWVTDAVKQHNAFINSGVVKSDDSITNQLTTPGGGLMLTIPHASALDTSIPPQNWDNHTDIVAHSLGSYTEQDVKFTDAQSFGNSDYDDYITGAKTLQQIASQFADYWAALDVKRVISATNIAFMNGTIQAAKTYNWANRQDFNPDDFVKALARFGDGNNNQPTQIAVNSGAYNYMVKQNFIQFIQPSTALEPIATYNGLKIIKDDSIPLDKNGNTSAYIYSQGAIAYGAVTPDGYLSTVSDPNAQGGINSITQKRVSSTHVMGTDADLSVCDPKNWKQALDTQSAPLYKPVSNDSLSDIQIVGYGFTIDKDFVVPGVNTTDGSTPSTQSTGSGSSSSSGSSKSSGK